MPEDGESGLLADSVYGIFVTKYFQTLSCCFLLQGWCHDGLSAHQKKCNTMSQVYPGDVLDTNAVIEFLTSEEALELPDKIEEVKSKTFKSS